ncbi:MAG: hypothetical protein U0T79_01770 [Ferruginibacter sp.]
MKKTTWCSLLFTTAIFLACNSNDASSASEATGLQQAPVPNVETDTLKNRIQDAIRELSIADLKTGGFSIEYLVVDSLSYKPASLKTYYRYRNEQLERSREEYRNITRKLLQSGTPVNMDKYREDSLKSDKAAATLQTLIAKSDTLLSLYEVHYHINARTNTTPYNTNYTKFLFSKDLKEVRMQFGGH